MEDARRILKNLIKTMLCNTFSFHERFHHVKLGFDDCTATIETNFHVCVKLEKLQQIQTL